MAGPLMDPFNIAGFHPSAISFLQQLMEGTKPMLAGYDARIADVQAQAEQANTGLAEAQANLDKLIAGGAPRVGNAEGFARRLAGGVSSAIAPQMQGMQLAESGIQSDEARMRENHMIKLQRLEQINSRLADKAAKFNDLESELKFRKEEFKVSQQLAALREADQRDLALKTRDEQRRQHDQMVARSDRDHRQQLVLANVDRAFKAHQNALETLARVQAGRKDKGGKLVPATPEAVNFAKKNVGKAFQEYENADLQLKAWQAATMGGSFDAKIWKSMPKSRDDMWSMGYMQQQIDMQVRDWLENEKGTLDQLLASANAMSESESGLPLDAREQRAFKQAWYALHPQAIAQRGVPTWLSQEEETRRLVQDRIGSGGSLTGPTGGW